jgi:hypothetical protein
MAPAPKAPPTVGTRQDVKNVVEKLGKDATSSIGKVNLIRLVHDAAANDNIVFEFTDSTLYQYIYTARAQLGYVNRRTYNDPETVRDKTTVADFMRIYSLGDEFSMDAATFLELVIEMKQIGNLDTFVTCLQAMVAIGRQISR